MECPICMEEFNSTRLRINCIQCKEFICSSCFLEILVTCEGLCHISYICPVCKQYVNVSRGFLETLLKRLPDKDYVELKDQNRKVILKMFKNLNTGEIKWKKRRNDSFFTPLLRFIIPSPPQ